MNSISEKEKKLSLALSKLKNFNLINPDLQKNIENLKIIKNSIFSSSLKTGHTIVISLISYCNFFF